MATLSLSETQYQTYRRDGLLFPVPVLSSEEVKRFRAASDTLENQLGGKPRTVEVRQMHLHFRWAYELATHERVLDAVEGVLGPNILIWATELFSKHPHDEKISIAWHRDRPYMGFDDGETASAWIALADSIPANGCMRAIPDANRRQPSGDDNRSGHAKRHAAAAEIDAARAIDVVLHAGEMSLHDQDILHGSGANHSDVKRIGFVVRYLTPEAQPRAGRPPAILARGEDVHGHFDLMEPPQDGDAPGALCGMRAAAARHFEAMLSRIGTRRH
jgi:non-haem Fe2+, alpha-ketoglutarate-dependent halogenase